MPTPLPRVERLKLQQIIRLTRDNVNAALEAHVTVGVLDDTQRADLKRAESDTTWLLAQVLDGPHYGALPWSTIKVIWDYSQLAADLLEAHKMPTLTQDTKEQIEPGWYRVTRELLGPDGNVIASKAFEVHNPVVAFEALDRWETDKKFRLELSAREIAA